jgi:hypothetical protein
MKMKGMLGLPGRTRTSKARTALEVIKDAEYPLVASLWKGTSVLVRVRELSEVQLLACGNFSLINLGEISSGPFSWHEWAEYAEQNYKILRACLVSPTYDEIFAIAGQGTMIKDSEARFREVDDLIESMPRGPARQALEKERDALRCTFDLILPDDFVAPIVAYVTGIGKTDIKKVTRDMLLSAAILAERGHDNPADHIDGAFTAFNRNDINRRAWFVLEDEREMNKRKVANGC